MNGRTKVSGERRPFFREVGALVVRVENILNVGTKRVTHGQRDTQTRQKAHSEGVKTCVRHFIWDNLMINLPKIMIKLTKMISMIADLDLLCKDIT